MEYRILGRTGLRVSAVALGCEGFIHKTPEEVCADFDFAIGHGVNFIDIYSPNPELRTNIGAALEGRRGDFVIQGHLCTTWENGQYLRTRDPETVPVAAALGLKALRVVETGGNSFAAEREQWDDGNNTLAIEPRVAIAYERNVETNERLAAAGIEVIAISGSELGSGRGGPRCMSCPISRDSL